jgi:hypothetical protein
MQPSDYSFHDPAHLAQTGAVLGPATSDLTLDAAPGQIIAMRLGVIASIRLNQPWLLQRSAAFARNRRYCLDQSDQLRDIIPVGLSKHYRKWDSFGVREDVVLATRLAAIGWVRSSFFPPCTARIEDESAMARAQSSFSTDRSLDSNV